MKRTLSRYFLMAACVLGLAGSLLSGCGTGLPALSPATSTPPVPISTVASGVAAEGHITPRDSVQLAFLTAGDVEDVLVKEGDRVEKGAVLVRLSNREQMEAAVTTARLEQLNAQLALDTLTEKAGLSSSAAQLALAQAETAYDKAKDHREGMNYPRGTQVDVDNAWSTYQLALTNLATAQNSYDKAVVLPDDHPLKAGAIYNLTTSQKARDKALATYNWLTGKPTAEDLNTADAELALAKSKLDDARRQWDKLMNGPDPDQLALALSRVDNARAQLAAAQAALDNLALKAPYAGTVVTLSIAPNEHVVPSQPVLLLADLSEWYVETSDLTEIDVVKLAAGQEAVVTPDALPDLKLSGHIDSISDGFKEKGGDILYTVRIRLDQVDPRLRWGMTVNAAFAEE